MSSTGAYPLGVIEGFFGRPWSWESRQAYAGFLAAQGFTAYIYAPKADACLRKQWQEDFPPVHFGHLCQLSRHMSQAGISFGIGLSPFELYRDFSPAKQALLRRKLDAINAIAPAILGIFFDDMQGDLDGLAKSQVEIMDFICQHSTARHFMLCPTYYSSDPRLARLFGSPPEHYLEELGAALDRAIDLFWTGPEIISREYPRGHLEDIAARMQRKPLLWDNYPVNDARQLTDFLHLLPFSKRGGELRALCAGHFSNPMNQAALSQLPLYSLPRLYADSSADPAALFRAACNSLCPPGLAADLQEDAAAFQHQGLAALSAEHKTRLLAKYARQLPHPMAVEIRDWLQGAYTFDPACLT